MILLLSLLFHLLFTLKIKSVTPYEKYQNIVDPFVTHSSSPLYFLGADSSGSIPITFSKTEKYIIYLYGDTCLGNISSNQRQLEYFVHNTIGIMKQGESYINFYWSTDPIKALFYSNSDTYYWLMQGISRKVTSDEHVVYIFSPNVINNGTGGLLFYINGVTVFKCIVNRANIMDVLGWNCVSEVLDHSISSKENKLFWGINSLWGDKKYIYLAAAIGDEGVLGRVAAKGSNISWSEDMVFLKSDGEWGKGVDNLKRIKNVPFNYESSLTYNEYLGKYLMISNDFLSFKAYLYYSDLISGPYKKMFVYEVPRVFSKIPNVFCYAFKIHPELSTKDNELVFTYNCNSFEFFKDFGKMNELYIPHYVKIILEKPVSTDLFIILFFASCFIILVGSFILMLIRMRIKDNQYTKIENID